ncbi:hypothetical protein FBU30_010453 [Linnemannia zychae]|nr:hypothetical protein FBU30_010453 [Linnemannia zychae]
MSPMKTSKKQKKKALVIQLGDDSTIFSVSKDDGKSDTHVVCPQCQETLVRRKAKRHYTNIHNQLAKVANYDDGDEYAQGVSVAKDQTDISAGPEQVAIQSKRRPDDNENAEIWKRLRRNVPSNTLESTISLMQARVYKISGHGMILQPEALAFLQTFLPAKYTISTIDLSQDHNKHMIDEGLPSTHDKLTHQHLTAMEQGKEVGLERVVGAILATRADTFKILYAEVYSRDSLDGSHAESHTAFPQASQRTGTQLNTRAN